MFGFSIKFSGRDGYHSRTRAFQTRPQTPDDAQQTCSLAAERALPGQTALDLTCGFGSRKVWPGPAGFRPRADAIRRAAERSRRAAERSYRTERPRSRALSPRRLRLGLFADGRLQRVRIRHLRTPTRGICRRVTGVFSAPTRGVSVGGFARTFFCTSTSLSTSSRSPLASSTLNVTPRPSTTSPWNRELSLRQRLRRIRSSRWTRAPRSSSTRRARQPRWTPAALRPLPQSSR